MDGRKSSKAELIDEVFGTLVAAGHVLLAPQLGLTQPLRSRGSYEIDAAYVPATVTEGPSSVLGP